MKKTLALLLVASLLLAGCTELTDAVDDAGDEILKIDVDEDIALEKVEDFLTVDESESFGITVMYEIDMSEMGDDSGMLEVDENAIMNIEMTEAWSPDGYHSSSVMGMDDGDVTISMMTSMTHVGTTMYVSIGYEIDGELGADATEDEIAEFDMMVAMMPEVEHFSMTTTTTHTEVIAAMAEESAEDSEDMDPMAFLEIIEVIEEYGTFTPAESVDGLQLFDVAIDMAAVMEGEAPTPAEALDMCDDDNSDGVSWSEFISEDCDETDSEDMTELETLFNDADTDMSGELTVDELQAFIDSVTVFYEDDMEEGEMEDDMGMPAMQVAFTSTGDIEYFSMEMDEMGDEPTVMMMYILTEERVDALFTGLDAGETVALPFSLSDSMYDYWDDEYYDDEYDYDDDSYESDYNYYDYCTEEGQDYLECWDAEWDTDGDGDYEMSDGYWSWECEQLTDGSWECLGSDDDDVDMMYWYCLPIVSQDVYDTDNFTTYDESGFDTSNCGMEALATYEPSDMSAVGLPSDFYVQDCWEAEDGTETCETDWVEMLGTYIAITNMDYSVSEDECMGSYFDGTCIDEMDIVEADDDSVLLSASFGYEFECADASDTIPLDYINDGFEDCTDGSDESEYDANGDDMNGFTCSDGTVIPLDYVLDDEEDCPGGDDEMPLMEEEFWFMYQYDASTGFGVIMMLEYDDMGEDEFVCEDGTTIPYDWVNDGMDDCSNGEDEFDDTDDEDMVCYNMNTHMVDPELTTQEDCEAAGLMWTEDQSDDYGGGDDSSDEYVLYVTSDMDFHFEGDLSDYKIELATCEYDYDMDTGEETTTCTTVMSVAIADAGEGSDIMFHDADSSGTLSVGDMIHIGEVSESWDEVRLYSISADAYSDENPMHDAPGFTGLVGMLALLGAAFIRRNE